MKLEKKILPSLQTYPEKVLQFGEGNFLRAFVDWIIHRMNKNAEFNGSVVVIQPIDKGMVELLNQQDCLYTLYLNGIKDGSAVSEHELIDSISRGINPYDDFDLYLKVAEQSSIRFILSNTTEAGIAFDPADSKDFKPPVTFPGKLTLFLHRRYKILGGTKESGLIIIPCELIDKNGQKLKEAVLQYIELWKLGGDFKTWILDSNLFCNSLVDRIVPGFPKDKINDIQKELGYEDNLVVEGEQFHLWVIEAPEWVKNEFPADKAGLNVLFVEDMTPYRTRKVRILNGAHTSMMPVAYLCGIDTVREAVEDEVVGKFVQQSVFEEIIPTLDLPEKELQDFANAVLDRFKNPFIKHFLISISLNSMSKFETRVLPSLLEYKTRMGQLPEKLVFSLAALIKFYKGDRNGEQIQVNDDQHILDLYKKVWGQYDGSESSVRSLVTEVLAYERNWKMDLNKIEGLTEAVSKYLYRIEKEGFKNVVTDIVN